MRRHYTKTMKHKLILRALEVTIVLLTIIGCTSKPQSTPTPLPIADFAAHDLNGNPVKLSDYLGKIVVLNFWATWCPPCRAEMPGLEAFYQEYRDQGVVVLAVNVSDSAADIIAFAREYGLTFPILRDSQREGIRTYKVQALPTTFFLDRQGQVRHRQVGAMSKDAFAQLLERLF